MMIRDLARHGRAALAALIAWSLALAPSAFAQSVDPGARALAALAYVTPPPVATGAAQPATVVTEGDSINWYGAPVSTSSAASGGYGGGSGYAVSELQNMLLYSGGRLTQKCDPSIAGTNRSWCFDYGYPSQTLTTMLSDEATNFWPALQKVGYCPTVFVGDSLLENSVNLGEAVATMKSELAAWINIHKSICPGSILMINTVHPDGRLTGNSTNLANWQTINAYLLTLDDNKTIFVTNISAANPITTESCPAGGSTGPLPGVGYQSASSSSIPAAGWTYLTATSESLSLQTGVHPRENAASLIGRAMALTYTCRVAPRQALAPTLLLSNNLTLAGSGAYSANHGSGTVPTNISIATAPSGAASTIALTALNPGGYTVTWTPDAGTPQDRFILRMTGSGFVPSPLPATEAAYAVVKIVSGAENIGQITTNLQVTQSLGTTYMELAPNPAITSPTHLAALYNNGDLLVLQTTPYPIPAGATHTADYDDIIVNTNETNSGDQSGGFTLQVQAQGIVPAFSSFLTGALPTVTSGYGTSPTVSGIGQVMPGGPISFQIKVGSSGTPAAAPVIAMPSNSPSGWSCSMSDETTALTGRQTAHNNNSVTWTWSSAPSLSDVIVGQCAPF